MQTATPQTPRIAIIGAGPAGLEAALYARALGWRVHVFEREAHPAASVRAWGHVSMWTPWGSLRTSLGSAAAAQTRPRTPPAADAIFPKGQDYCERYLDALAAFLGDDLHLETRVVAVGRAFLFPDEGNEQARQARRFRLLTRSSREERVFNADFLMDAAGVSHAPNWLGAGGMPAQGEQGVTGPLFRTIPDAGGRDRIHFLGKRVLLIGDGGSAATVAAAVRPLLSHDPPMTLLWAVRHGRPLPLPYAPNDALARRDLVFQQANLVVASGLEGVEYLPNTQVDAVAYNLTTGVFHVTLQVGAVTRRVVVDTVVACVGAKLHSQTWERVLSSDEAGVYVVGAKAARPGDDGAVLSSVPGQVRAAFAQMTGRVDLDLYGA